MGSTKLLVILLVFCIQNILCIDVDSEIKSENLLNKPYSLASRNRDIRGVLEQIKSAADLIKKNAIASWNYLKRVAESTRENIRKLASSARQFAIKLEKSLEDQLNILRSKLNDIITDVLGTGKLVRKCLRDEGENIQSTLKEISSNMANCLSNQISKLTQIQGKQERIGVNDTLFIEDLDIKLDGCEADKSNYEECLYIVRDLVYDDLEEKHNEIQNTSIESRSLADDIRDTIFKCAQENLAEATTFLSSEVMEVVRCALKSVGINESILE